MHPRPVLPHLGHDVPLLELTGVVHQERGTLWWGRVRKALLIVAVSNMYDVRMDSRGTGKTAFRAFRVAFEIFRCFRPSQRQAGLQTVLSKVSDMK